MTKRYPALTQEVFDVSGAGDTVLAAITGGMLAHLPMEETLSLQTCVLQRSSKTRNDANQFKLLVPASDVMKDTLHFEDSGSYASLDATRQTDRFTNGCFDLLHRGHVEFKFAKSQGDVLIVGLNSDESVKRLKGEGRPVNNEQDRAAMLRALRS